MAAAPPGDFASSLLAGARAILRSPLGDELAAFAPQLEACGVRADRDLRTGGVTRSRSNQAGRGNGRRLRRLRPKK